MCSFHLSFVLHRSVHYIGIAESDCSIPETDSVKQIPIKEHLVCVYSEKNKYTVTNLL